MHKIVIEKIERDVVFASLHERKQFWFFKWFKRVDWFYHFDDSLVWAQIERWKLKHVVIQIENKVN